MLASLLLALAAPNAPQAVPAGQAITSESLKQGPYQADAMELAKSVVPQAAFRAMINDVLRKGLRLGLGDEAAVMEKESPGVLAELDQAVATAAAPLIGRYHRETLEQYARLYSRSFTPQDLAVVTSFYRSATGAKLIAKKYAYLSNGEAISELILSEKPVTGRDIAAINRGIVTDMMADFNAEDKMLLTALTKSPAFAKMQALVPIINKLESDVANEDDPELEAAIDAAAQRVMKKRKLID